MTRKSVLIVDDDLDIREVLSETLADRGFDVATAANGLEALGKLRELSVRPSVILLDLMMPIMDGWEFRRRQASNPAIANVPVIVLSTLDQARAANVSAEAFLKKPLDFDRLLQLVRQYCR